MRVTAMKQIHELAKYRKVAGLTQEQLARRSGVDAALISKFERGERVRLPYEDIVRLARALNLTPEELVPVADKVRKPRAHAAKPATEETRTA